MLSHAQIGRSRMISCHLRDIGEYRSTVGYICYRGKDPWGNVNGGRVEPLCRLTHVILFVPIKDRTVVGTFVKIKCIPLTQLAGQLVPIAKPSSSIQVGPRSVKVRTLDGSKDLRGSRREPKDRLGQNVLVAGCP